MENKFIIRKGFVSNDNSVITGSLSITAGVTAATYYGDGSQLSGILTSIPANLVSGSSQIDFGGISNIPSLISGSSQIIIGDTTGQLDASRITGTITADSVEYVNVLNKPTLISGSIQVSHDQTINYVSGQHFLQSEISITESQISNLVHYTNTDVETYLNTKNTITGSSQVDHNLTTNYESSRHFLQSEIIIIESQISDLTHYTDTDVLTYINTLGVVTGSYQISYSGLNGIPVGIISGSSQLDGTTINNLSVTNGTFGGDGTNLTGVLHNVPSGTVSGSSQITLSGTIGNLDGSRIIGDVQASSVEYTNILNLPTLVSGSSQINHNTTTNYIAGQHFLQSEIVLTKSQISDLDTTLYLPKTAGNTQSLTGILFGTNAEFSGTVKGSPATLSNEYVTKDQLDAAGGEYYVGTIDPTGNTYPNSSGETKGAYWIVSGLGANTTFTYTSGTLNGETVEDGYKLVFNSSNFDIVIPPSVNWGSIGGSLPSQTDLVAEFNLKENIIVKNTGFNKNFGTFAGDVSEGNHVHTFLDITNIPTLISGSSQIDHDLTTNFDQSEHFTQGQISISESQISDFSSGDYLPLSGGTMTGNLIIDASTQLSIGTIGTISHETSLVHFNSLASIKITAGSSILLETVQGGYEMRIGKLGGTRFYHGVSVDHHLSAESVSSTNGYHLETAAASLDFWDDREEDDDPTVSIKLDATGNLVFNNITNGYLFTGSMDVTGSVTSISFIKKGGLNTEYLLADGTTTTSSGTLPSNIVSSSVQIDHDQTTNFDQNEHFTQASISIPSSQLTDSSNIAYTNISNTFTVNQTISGSLNLTGNVRANSGIVDTIETKTLNVTDWLGSNNPVIRLYGGSHFYFWNKWVDGDSNFEMGTISGIPIKLVGDWIYERTNAEIDALTIENIVTKGWVQNAVSSSVVVLPSGIVTGSIQIDHDQTTNFNQNEHFLQSQISITESQISDLSHTAIPVGTVSGSSQIDHDQTTNFNQSEHFTQGSISITESQISDLTHTVIPVGTISGSSQINASLVTTGVFPSSVIPASAISETFVVATQTEQLALTAGKGDVAIRTDENKSYINQSGTNTTMGDWQLLLTPTDSVTSVNGQTGVIVLTSTNITEGTNLYYTDTRVSANTNVSANTLKVGYQDSLVKTFINSENVLSGSFDSHLPPGTVSGSSQIDHDQTTNFVQGEHFTQAQILIPSSQLTDSSNVALKNIDNEFSVRQNLNNGVLLTSTNSDSYVLKLVQGAGASAAHFSSTGGDYLGWIGYGTAESGSAGRRFAFESTPANQGRNFGLYIYDSAGGNPHKPFSAGYDAFTIGSTGVDLNFRVASVDTYYLISTDAYNDRVGIGILNPTEKLDVSGSVKSTSFIKSGATNDDILLGDGTTSSLSNLTISGNVSESSQIDHDQTTNFDQNEHFLQSEISITESQISDLSHTVIPTGTVTSSVQIDHDQTTNFVQGEHFLQSEISITESQISDLTHYTTSDLPSGTISGSSQLSGEYIDTLYVEHFGGTGSFHGTFYGDGTNISGVLHSLPNGTVSGSSQITIGDTVGNLDGSRVVGNIQASSVEYVNVLNKPTLYSSSFQVDHDQTLNFESNEHFTQTQISITESQISDLGNYLPLTGGTIIGNVLIQSGSMLSFGNNGGIIDDGTKLEIRYLNGFKIHNPTGPATSTYFEISKLGSIDYIGEMTGDSLELSDWLYTPGISSDEFKKNGSTNDDILLGDGTTTSLSNLSINGTVSGSPQIDHNQTTNYLSTQHFTQAEISITEDQISDLQHYTNTDTLTYINTVGVLSGSFNSHLPSGTVSGSSQIDHDQTTNFVVNEHIDWTTDQGGTNINIGNYENTTYSVFTTTTDGLVPKTTTSNTTDYLRRDGQWANPASSNGTAEQETLTSVGGETTFVLSNLLTLSYKYFLYINGVLQREGVSYDYQLSHASVTTITFNTALEVGDYVDFYYHNQDAASPYTTYDLTNTTVTNGSQISLVGSNSSTDLVKIVGSGDTTVTYTDSETITISSTGGGTSYTDVNNKTYLDSINVLSGSLNNRSISGLNLYTVSATGSFQGTFFGDGSNLTGVTSYTDTDTETYINSKSVISGSSQLDMTNYSGHIIPSATDTYDLGSPTRQWRDLFLSSGSLYIDGTKVISSNATDLIITTDTNQSLKLYEDGSDVIAIQTVNGDITLTSIGTGNVEIDAPLQINAGKNVISSDGNAINFGDGLNVTGNVTATSFTGDGSSITNIAGSLPSGTISGSSQIDASLVTTGVFPSSVMPPIAITDTFVVNTEGAQLGLTAQKGDVAVRSDENKSYINKTGYNTSMTDWQVLLTPTAAVLSVNSQTGVIVLTSTNINEGTNLYYTDTRVKTKLDVENVVTGSSQIDHDQTTNYVSDEHFTQGSISIPSSQLTDSSNIAYTNGAETFDNNLTVSGKLIQGGGSYLFTMDGGNGGGPRLTLGTVANPDSFFTLGAYGNITNFYSKDRDLKLFTDDSFIYIDDGSTAIGIHKIPTTGIALDVLGDTLITGSVTATEYYGDGSNLTGISGGSDISSSLQLDDTTNIAYTNGAETFDGNLTVSGNVITDYIQSTGTSYLDLGNTLTLNGYAASIIRINGNTKLYVGGSFINAYTNLQPNASDSLTLGSDTRKWKDVYSTSGSFTHVSASVYYGDGSNLTGISAGSGDSLPINATVLDKSVNYTTTLAESGSTVRMTGGDTLTLSGITQIGFQQELLNDTGGNISITTADTVLGQVEDIEDGYSAYYQLVAPSTWSLSVDGSTTNGDMLVADWGSGTVNQVEDSRLLGGYDRGNFLRSNTDDSFTNGYLRFYDGTTLSIGTDQDTKFTFDGTNTIVTHITGDYIHNQTTGTFVISGSLAMSNGTLNMKQNNIINVNSITYGSTGERIGLASDGTRISNGHAFSNVANTYDLGKSTLRWKTVYANSGSFNGGMIISGSCDVSGSLGSVNAVLYGDGSNLTGIAGGGGSDISSSLQLNDTTNILYKDGINQMTGNIGIGIAPGGYKFRVQGLASFTGGTHIQGTHLNMGNNIPIRFGADTRTLVSNGTDITLSNGDGNFIVSGSTQLYNSGSTVLDIQGSQGQLFSVSDEDDEILFAVSDISGQPFLEVNVSGSVDVNADFTATKYLDVGGSKELGNEIRVGSGVSQSGTIAEFYLDIGDTAKIVVYVELASDSSLVSQTEFTVTRSKSTSMYYTILNSVNGLNNGHLYPRFLQDNTDLSKWYMRIGEHTALTSTYQTRVKLYRYADNLNTDEGIVYPSWRDISGYTTIPSGMTSRYTTSYFITNGNHPSNVGIFKASSIVATSSITTNDNVELRFGTSGLESGISSNGTDTSWKIKRNKIVFKDNSDGEILSLQSGSVNVNASLVPELTAPTTATSTGVAGEIRTDVNYIYVCTATNTWKRSALTTW